MPVDAPPPEDPPYGRLADLVAEPHRFTGTGVSVLIALEAMDLTDSAVNGDPVSDGWPWRPPTYWISVSPPPGTHMLDSATTDLTTWPQGNAQVAA
ncbi:hypothetical protein GCM10010156_57310 [Planobispora rosea]|uniref:Uncharacterized protein n=1 Tax=Planobispora rosea TaxID=35762 RepID=A0A8J3WEJ7_PLARO|nr:hypothetical protein GCM10010156_57310 [Planobispora rosea]GIH87034.1 hypothetical protein Pro02_54420 [Planobispora rosea]